MDKQARYFWTEVVLRYNVLHYFEGGKHKEKGSMIELVFLQI